MKETAATSNQAEREERTRFWARVFLGVSLSVLIHVVVSIATYELAEYAEQNDARKNRTATLIDWIEPTELKKEDWESRNAQVVRQAQLPKELLDLNLKVERRFQSEEEQTVKKETRAAQTGLTENRVESLDLSESRSVQRATAQKPLDAKNADPKNAESPKQKASASGPRERLPEFVPNSIFVEGLGDIAVEVKREKASGSKGRDFSESRELILPSDPRRNRGVSTTGEELPKDIQIGDFTALNTDRFIYYTYYARIEEAIRHRWVRYVKAAIYGGGDLSPGQSKFETNVEIVLNREGRFERAIIHQGSGSRDLDAAGIHAFREAREFPHPPRGMLKPDETIRLLYSFHVDSLPPLTARGKSVPSEDVQ